METELAKLKRHMVAGDHRAALKLAASWGRLGPEKAAIQRGWAALCNPSFYRQIGQDPAGHVAEGLAAIRRRYGIEETKG